VEMLFAWNVLGLGANVYYWFGISQWFSKFGKEIQYWPYYQFNGHTWCFWLLVAKIQGRRWIENGHNNCKGSN